MAARHGGAAAPDRSAALYYLDKARKWLVTRDDLVIPQAAALNPEFFEIVYRDLLNQSKTRPPAQAALDPADGYLALRTPRLFTP